MRKFVPHTAETAPEASREGLAGAKRKFGFVPNMIGVLAESPATLDGLQALHGAFEQSSFNPKERELLLLAVSTVNGCTYCVPAHSAAAKAAGQSDDVIEAFREGKPIADARLAALHAFATAVVEKRGRVSEAEVDAFIDAGFTKAQVLEVVLGASLMTLTNYTNHIANVPLDAAFEPFRWSKREAT